MPTKLVQLTVPADHEDEASRLPRCYACHHHQTVSVLRDDSRIKGLVFLQAGEDTVVLQFRVEDRDAVRVLTRLQKTGVGVRYGFCDVMQLVAGTAVVDEDYGIQFDSRAMSLTPAEIHKTISEKALISRDTFILLIISGIVCLIGLATDSQVYVVASMLMSPLMGPIVGASFGLATFNKGLFLAGWRNIIIMLVLTFSVAFILGAAFCPFATILLWPTDEMASRGLNVDLLFGALIAIAGGAAVAVAECNANISSIVGIGIAASLLPPTVNSGLCLASVFLGPLVAPHIDFDEKVYLEIAWGSVLLVLVNVFFIYSTAFTLFKMITPLQQFRFQAAENKDLGIDLGLSIFRRSLFRAQQRKAEQSPLHPPPSTATTPKSVAKSERLRFSSMG